MGGVTGVLVIHNDCSLLADTLRTAAPYIDNLLIADGAYEWVAPFCLREGEDPTRSTDEMLDIVESARIPYRYIPGLWKSETHKRSASLEQAKCDRIMLIDSDELYDVDDAALDSFFRSGKALASLDCPLYMHPDVVTYHRATSCLPSKQVFINKLRHNVSDIVGSLWLLLPEEERTRRITGRDVLRESVGVLHHLSLFRTGGNPYRRSRFYNLLSMRIGKSIGLAGGGRFEDDAAFLSLLTTLDQEALNTLFHFHRIAAAFPALKENQYLGEAPAPRAVQAEQIRHAYDGMLADQASRTRWAMGRTHRVFVERPIFLDVTEWYGKSASVRLCCGAGRGWGAAARLHGDFGRERVVIPLAATEISGFDCSFGLQRFPRYPRRVLLEVVLSSTTPVLGITLEVC
ncbi:MAG: hypothetical protein AB7P69_17770 [Candidatus Binatia bacterium]